MSILLPGGSTDVFHVFRLNLSGAELPHSHLYPAASRSLHTGYNDLFVPCPQNLPLLHLASFQLVLQIQVKVPSAEQPFLTSQTSLGPYFMLSYHPTLLPHCIIVINFVITNLISIRPPSKFQETKSGLTSVGLSERHDAYLQQMALVQFWKY